MVTLELSTEPGRVLTGGFAGVVGGVVFGAMMQMSGMMPMIAALVGSSSVVAGWVVHLAISFAFGAAYGAAVAAKGLGANALLGALYGVGLWAVAAMLVMRSVMGAPIQIDGMATRSLMGHIVYGIFLGAAYSQWAPHDAERPAAVAK